MSRTGEHAVVSPSVAANGAGRVVWMSGTAAVDVGGSIRPNIGPGSAASPAAPETLDWLAAALVRRGDHHAALQAYRELILERTAQQGGDHLDTWIARHNFTVVLHRLGDVEEAEDCLTDVLAAYRRKCGARHATTLEAQVELAAMKSRRGDATAAISLLADALQEYRDTHGPHHSSVRELTRTLAQLRY